MIWLFRAIPYILFMIVGSIMVQFSLDYWGVFTLSILTISIGVYYIDTKLLNGG